MSFTNDSGTCHQCKKIGFCEYYAGYPLCMDCLRQVNNTSKNKTLIYLKDTFSAAVTCLGLCLTIIPGFIFSGILILEEFVSKQKSPLGYFLFAVTLAWTVYLIWLIGILLVSSIIVTELALCCYLAFRDHRLEIKHAQSLRRK